MSKKRIQQKECGKGDHSYSAWLGSQPGDGEGNRREFAEANPDVLPAPDTDKSADQEAVRLLLDNAAVRFAVFTAMEAAVFMTVHVDGLTERQAAAKLGRSRDEVRDAIQGVRTVVRRTIERVRAGVDPVSGK
jgi:DNA-directed RNA polymerase specialized sigma24 family protein